MYNKRNKKKSLRAAIIGCGAIVQEYHLPVIAKLNNISIIQLVDTDRSRLKSLARIYRIQSIENHYRDIRDDVDIALVALPNNLHDLVVTELLKKKIHVFCEKPMATTFVGATRMIQTSKSHNKILCIGMIRRYFLIYKELKRIITTLELGRPMRFLYEEGYPYEWPIRTLYVFNKKESGGGVLMDTGSHVLDLLAWFFGTAQTYSYYDDNYNGVEANAKIEITYKNKLGIVIGQIELSRTRNLLNGFIVEFEEGKVEIDITDMTKFKIIQGKKIKYRKFNQNFSDAIKLELEDFIGKVTAGLEENYLDDIAQTIKIIEECYQNKHQLNYGTYS